MAAPLGLKPSHSVRGSCKASFMGLTGALQKLSLGANVQRRQQLSVQAGRVCDLTGKKANNGYVVTFSHKRIKKLQGVNLQYKKIYWPEEKRWVRLRVSTKAMKTVEKKGLQTMAKDIGLDLYSLPYSDVRPERQEWLASQPKTPPQSKTHIGKSRRMKNPEKLAASKKKPLVARYILGNRVILTRDPTYVPEYAN